MRSSCVPARLATTLAGGIWAAVETAAGNTRVVYSGDFAAALDAGGDAADLLADRVAADRTRTMAQDRHKPARSPSYFADAL